MENNNKFSRGEEMANALSHFAGTLFGVAALVLMIRSSLIGGTILHLLSTSVFGITIIILYLSSTLTHSLPAGKVKDLFFNVDRIAIYLLIAGTYTPIALIVLNGSLGWIILGIEWGMAMVGTILILSRPGEFNKGVNIYYITSYVVMGWLLLIALEPLFRSMSLMGALWIVIGGVCYSIGILFYNTLIFPYHHLIWHLMVLAGTVSHFIAVFFYIIPR